MRALDAKGIPTGAPERHIICYGEMHRGALSGGCIVGIYDEKI